MAATYLGLGAILSGVGMGTDWRDPDVPGDASIDINWYQERARQAEAAKLDFVFIVDSPYITPDSAPHYLNRLEPLTLLSAVAAVTSHIGLVATLTTSYTEPFNVARQFASLDLISQGRAGWNVVTTGLEGAARNFGRDEHIEHGTRYRRAKEHVGVVQGLWDSYEDDAFPRDRESGVFLDRTRQHPLNHRGEFFSVAGPLNISRSPQGQPVIFQAGASEDGRTLAGEIAEGIFASAEAFDEALEYSTDLKRRAVLAGRSADDIRIFPGIAPIIADTEEEARQRQEERQGKVDFEKALVQLGRPFNYHDFSQYPLDAPFPDLGDLGLNGYRGHAERIRNVAREEGLTLRETVWRFATRRSPFVGTPQHVAAEMERWFLAGAADGFIFHTASPREFATLLNQVVPILRERGLVRTEYESTTLRGNLGLSVPANRHTTARRATSATRTDAGAGIAVAAGG